MKIVKGWLGTTVAAAVVAAATSSYAIPTLFITDTVGDSVLVADGSVSDNQPASGVVGWTGTLGVWNLTISTTAISSGNGTSPSFDLSSVQASTTGAPGNAPYTLQVWFGDVNLGPTTGSFLATIGGTTQGTVTYNTYEDPNSNLLLPTQLLTSQTFGSTPFAGSQSSTNEMLPFAYSLSQEVVINQMGPGKTSFDATLDVLPTVPEGGMTLVLLGSSLIALWAFGRTHKSIRA